MAKKSAIQKIEDHEKLVRGLAHVMYPAALTMVHNISDDVGSDSWVHLSAFTQSVRGNDLGRSPVDRVLVEFGIH